MKREKDGKDLIPIVFGDDRDDDDDDDVAGGDRFVFDSEVNRRGG